MSLIDGRQVRRHFSASSRQYDGHAGVQKRVARKVAELVETQGPAQGLFLEIGTGTGYLAERICRLRPGLRPLVSDLAHAMTLRARQRLGDVRAVDLDAVALPLAADSLPLVCSASVYQWVENRALAFAECRRVLQPQGVFAFALFGCRTLWELKESYREAVRSVRQRQPDHLHRLPGLESVREALRQGGFTDFQAWEEEECERHASVPALLRSLKGVGAHNASPQRPRGLASRQVMQRLGEIYPRRFADQGSLPATYHVIYGLARKS